MPGAAALRAATASTAMGRLADAGPTREPDRNPARPGVGDGLRARRDEGHGFGGVRGGLR